jgi:hypothetical protein
MTVYGRCRDGCHSLSVCGTQIVVKCLAKRKPSTRWLCVGHMTLTDELIRWVEIPVLLSKDS